MKSIMMLTAAILLTLLTSGCSSTPSKTEMADQLKANLLADGGGSLYEVLEVAVVSGRELSEVEYEGTLEYTLKFKVGLADLVKELKQGSTGLDAIDGMMFISALKEQYGQFKTGDTVKGKDAYLFVKLEDGWQLLTLD